MEELTYIKTDRNGTKIYHDYTCQRCGGAGFSDKWLFTGKTCFECGGSGKRNTPRIIKEYTPEHRAKLDKKELDRSIDRIKEQNKQFYKNFGFSETGSGYMYLGDTRGIKDHLKRGGAKFNNYLHWVSPTPIGDYPHIEVTALEVCNLGEIYCLDCEKCEAFKEKHHIEW